jgi:hypothetical protein
MHRTADHFHQSLLSIIVLAAQPIQPGVEFAHEAELPDLFSLSIHSRPWLSAEVWLSTWLSKPCKKPSAAVTLGFLMW